MQPDSDRRKQAEDGARKPIRTSRALLNTSTALPAVEGPAVGKSGALPPAEGSAVGKSGAPPPIEVLAVSITDASRITGMSRSELYRRLGRKQVRAIKSGCRTLILMDSLRQHLASLPAATFRAPRSDDQKKQPRAD